MKKNGKINFKKQRLDLITNLKKSVIFLILSIFSISPTSANININMQTGSENHSEHRTWFKFNASPGEIINSSIILKNLGTETENFIIYSADAWLNETGSFAIKQYQEKQEALGKWTKLSNTNLTLNPSQEIEIPFEIKIPENATPGTYAGGIVIENTLSNIKFTDCSENNTINCSSRVKIKTRTGNRIYLNVIGTPNPSIEFMEFTYTPKQNGSINFKFKINNTGNVAFEPEAEIKLFSLSGKLIKTLNFPLGDSLPNSLTTPTINWKPDFPFGFYKATATIIFKEKFTNNNLRGSALTSEKNITLFIAPWYIFYPLFFFPLIILTFFAYRKHETNLLLAQSKFYKIKQNDNLLKLAEKSAISWKKLARINKIHAPYIIKPGQIIHIPKKQNSTKKQN